MATASVNVDLSAMDFNAFPQEVIATKDRVKREVPANILAMAQASWEAKERRQITLRGQKPEVVTAFVEALKDAGDWTHVPGKPDEPEPTTVVVTVDGIVVKYRAAQRRGRKAGTSSEEEPNGNGESAE